MKLTVNACKSLADGYHTTKAEKLQLPEIFDATKNMLDLAIAEHFSA